MAESIKKSKKKNWGVYNSYSYKVIVVNGFQLSVVKPKPKFSLLPITTGTDMQFDQPIKTRSYRCNIYSQHQVRENYLCASFLN